MLRYKMKLLPAKDSSSNLLVKSRLCWLISERQKYFGDGTGVGLRKDDAELTAAFNKALGELRQDGTYDKMAKKYFDFNVYGD